MTIRGAALFIALLPAFVSAQCLPKKVFWDLLDQNTFSISDSRLLPYLRGIKKDAINCGFRNDSLEAKANRLLGETYLKLLKPDSARYFIGESMRINQLPGNSSALPYNVRNYLSLAAIEKLNGNTHGMRLALNNCLVLAQKFENSPPEALQAYYQLSELQFEEGHFKACVTESTTAEIVARNSGDVHTLARLYLLQARAYFAMQDGANSATAINKAVETGKTIGNPAERGLFLTEIATLREHQNRKNEAQESYLQSISLLKDVTRSDLIGNSYRKLGKLSLSGSEPDYKKAQYYLQKALENNISDSDKADAAEHLAKTFSATGNLQKALQFYQIALESLLTEFCPEKLSDNPQLAQTKTISEKIQLYSILVGKGNVWLDSVRTTAEKPRLRGDITNHALQIYFLADSLANLIVWNNESRLSNPLWKLTSSTHYQNALETCYLNKRNDQAFYFIEKYRALQLKDKLGIPEKVSGKDGIVPPQMDQLNREIKQYRSLMHHSKSYPDEMVFGKKLRQLVQQRNQLAHELASESQYYSLQLDERNIPDLSTFRRDIIVPLGRTGAYLAFFEGPENSFGLLVTSHTLSLRKFPTASFQSLAKEYSQLLSHSDGSSSQRFLNVSGELYRTIVAPFSISPLNRIIVSPGGSLLPFESLTRSGGSPEFLVHTHAFSYVYSAAQLYVAAMPGLPFPFHKNFLGMSPETFSYNSSDKNVLNIRKTLKELGNRFFLPTIYTGTKATAGKFSKEAPGFKVVQLFASYDMEVGDPRIAFSDSVLAWKSLREKRFKTQLFVMPEAPNRTNGGSGQDAAFELGRELTALGVKSVIARLWTGNPERDLVRLNGLYQHILEDHPLDMALRQSKLDWLRKHPESHPGEWAGAVLIGNVAQVSTDKEVYFGLISGIILFMITLYTTFVVQKKRRRKPVEESYDS